MPDVTGEPICVTPLKIVNVTVPEFTVPDGLVTVADSATVWLLALNDADAFAAVVVVEAAFTVRFWLLSELARKFPPPE